YRAFAGREAQANLRELVVRTDELHVAERQRLPFQEILAAAEQSMRRVIVEPVDFGVDAIVGIAGASPRFLVADVCAPLDVFDAYFFFTQQRHSERQARAVVVGAHFASPPHRPHALTIIYES